PRFAISSVAGDASSLSAEASRVLASAGVLPVDRSEYAFGRIRVRPFLCAKSWAVFRETRPVCAYAASLSTAAFAGARSSVLFHGAGNPDGARDGSFRRMPGLRHRRELSLLHPFPEYFRDPWRFHPHSLANHDAQSTF